MDTLISELCPDLILDCEVAWRLMIALSDSSPRRVSTILRRARDKKDGFFFGESSCSSDGVVGVLPIHMTANLPRMSLLRTSF